MNAALYTLRCTQCGISLDYLKIMTIGAVFDVFTELGNDKCEYPYRATQEDMDRL